jgi:hypothetical protein
MTSDLQKNLYTILHTKPVHIHAVLEVMGPGWQPLNVATVAS